MKKPPKSLVTALFLVFTASPILAREFTGLTSGGPSGLVLSPSADVIKHNWYAVGLHRGVVKLAYGLFGLVEAGAVTPDLFNQPNKDDWHSETRGFVKLAFHAPERLWWIPDLAVGTSNSIDLSVESNYGVATWYFGIRDWTMETLVGYGTGRFMNEPFGGLGIIPGRLLGNAVKFIAEYSGHQADLGARFALSRDMRLDFVMLMTAIPPHDEPGEWLIKLDRGLLGASRAAPAIKPPKPGKS